MAAPIPSYVVKVKQTGGSNLEVTLISSINSSPGWIATPSFLGTLALNSTRTINLPLSSTSNVTAAYIISDKVSADPQFMICTICNINGSLYIYANDVSYAVNVNVEYTINVYKGKLDYIRFSSTSNGTISTPIDGNIQITAGEIYDISTTMGNRTPIRNLYFTSPNPSYTLTVQNAQNMQNVQIGNTVYSNFPANINISANTTMQARGNPQPTITVDYERTSTPVVTNTP